MVVEFRVGMAVVGDDRGGSNSRVAQRPDGAWSLEDARRRREQRQPGPTASAHLRSGETDEDLSALALSLADSLTFDGTPLSQLDIDQDLDASTPERPAGDAPTAEEIMRALEAEQKSSISRHLGSVTAGAAGGPPAGAKILTTFSSGGRI
jgi:hypothetical protein